MPKYQSAAYIGVFGYILAEPAFIMKIFTLFNSLLLGGLI